jgi:glycosyltransferase involved in cell wall biosynthesis
MNIKPFVSIIVPVYNAAEYLGKCLASIEMSSYKFHEIVVIDDGSTDDSAEIALKNGARVFKLNNQSGPAAARNFGSKQAKGDILLFIDSDILIQKETVARVVKNFNENRDIAAIFGSYDDKPAENNFFSQYKNLQHHFVHQVSNARAITFWSGCGAIQKEVFHAVGGFDNRKYSRPSIEDIELGYRLKKSGYSIWLDKDLEVKHLKKWTFLSLLRADIFNRAIPWSKLILESREMVNDLNLQISQKISTVLVAVSLVIIPFSLFIPELIYLIPLFLVSIIALNRKLFMFFLNRKGPIFTFSAFFMYLLYYLYSGVAFSVCWILYKLRG